jgi:hypothetical protein
MSNIVKNLKQTLDLFEGLENLADKLEEMKEIIKKSHKGDYLSADLDKKIEDGILDKIHNANKHQLNIILNGGYKFRFYTELNDKENLRNEVQKRLRDNKLNSLIN